MWYLACFTYNSVTGIVGIKGSLMMVQAYEKDDFRHISCAYDLKPDAPTEHHICVEFRHIG
jgi:hypothetical protein